MKSRAAYAITPVWTVRLTALTGLERTGAFPVGSQAGLSATGCAVLCADGSVVFFALRYGGRTPCASLPAEAWAEGFGSVSHSGCSIPIRFRYDPWPARALACRSGCWRGGRPDAGTRQLLARKPCVAKPWGNITTNISVTCNPPTS